MPGPYKIGEAAALLNLKTYVLRFWETEFSQIVPSRTETGRRVYTEEDLALLERIRFLLYEHGLTIEGARRVLSEEAAKGVSYTLPSTPERPATEPGGGEAVVTPTSPAKPASRNAPVDVPLGGANVVVALTNPEKPTTLPSTQVKRTRPDPVQPTPPAPTLRKPASRNTLDDMLHNGDEDCLSASHKDFRCELRAELEKVKALLAGSTPQGDHSA